MASSNVEVFHRQALLYNSSSDSEIRIFYMEAHPSGGNKKGTILLIHGFPQTSYQFRHVIKPLASAGYHVVVPDYRGHGFSSHPLLPVSAFTKKEIATDLFKLITDHLGIKEKIHVVGHDIGGMIAHAYVAQFSENVDSIGHNPEIAVALVTGKEKMYLKHFYDRLTQNQAVFTPDVLEFYTMQYSMPDALRCAFFTYSAFELDAQHNKEWRDKNGKVTVRNMILSGDQSWAAPSSNSMASEMYIGPEVGIVENSGHYLAEENPDGFVKQVLSFINA